MKIIKNLVQGTEEWLNVRKGVITGTKLKSVTGGPKAQLTGMYELLAEQYIEEEDLKAWEILERGNELEGRAKYLFESVTDKLVDEVGFIQKDEKLGLSPDGIIQTGERVNKESATKEPVYGEALEIKCPRGKNYIKYLLEDKIPDEYKNQVVNYFIVMEDLEKLFFMIYNPDVINSLKEYHIIEVTRKDLQVDINKANEKLSDFRIRWETLEKDLIKK